MMVSFRFFMVIHKIDAPLRQELTGRLQELLPTRNILERVYRIYSGCGLQRMPNALLCDVSCSHYRHDI